MPSGASSTAFLPSRRMRKKERTRREIYGAAMRLFSDRGYDRVTLDQICEAADVARATFFLHFPNKAALLIEFSRSFAAEFASQLPDPRGSSLGEFEQLIERLSERWLAEGPVLFAMLREFMSMPGAFLSQDAGTLELPQLCAEIVARGQARGEFRADVDARLVVSAVFLTAASVLSGAVFRDDAVAPEEIRRQFLALLLHGLAPH